MTKLIFWISQKKHLKEARLENYIVKKLVNFGDISYDENADLLYDLAGQVVSHFLNNFSEEDTHKTLFYYQIPIATFIHKQMQQNFWEETTSQLQPLSISKCSKIFGKKPQAIKSKSAKVSPH